MQTSEGRGKPSKTESRAATQNLERRRLALAQWGAVCVTLVALTSYRVGGFLRYPFADGDLFWQRRLGEFVIAQHAIPHALGNDVFSAPGAPWIPQEWLFSTFVAFAFDHGALWVIAVLSGVFAFVALAISAWRAIRSGSTTWAVTIVGILAAITVSPNFALRAEVWVWPLFALALLVLDSDDGPFLWWLVPIAILWANLHASVMFIVPVVWLKTVLQLLMRRSARTHLLLSVAVPLATLCTPFGIDLPRYAIELLHSPLRPYIAQWRPISPESIYVKFGFFPLAALLVLAIVRRVWATRPFDVVLSIVLAILTCFASRNAALFGLAAIVPASLTLAASSSTLKPSRVRSGILAAEGLALLIAATAFGWFGFQVGSPGIQWPAPFGSVKQLAARPGEHRLFCYEYSWCSVALGEGDTRIFLDGRADPYPPKVWADFGTITRERPGWEQLLRDYDVNAVITWRGGVFESKMQGLPDWYEITNTDDQCCVLFLRLAGGR